jgi:hypothetical protein
MHEEASSSPSRPRPGTPARAAATALAAGVLITVVALALLMAVDWSVVGLLDWPRPVFLAGEILATVGALAIGGWATMKVYALERLTGTPDRT